jgi:hypothetical protein
VDPKMSFLCSIYNSEERSIRQSSISESEVDIAKQCIYEGLVELNRVWNILTLTHDGSEVCSNFYMNLCGAKKDAASVNVAKGILRDAILLSELERVTLGYLCNGKIVPSELVGRAALLNLCAIGLAMNDNSVEGGYYITDRGIKVFDVLIYTELGEIIGHVT